MTGEQSFLKKLLIRITPALTILGNNFSQQGAASVEE